jgi:hypothetical protein
MHIPALAQIPGLTTGWLLAQANPAEPATPQASGAATTPIIMGALFGAFAGLLAGLLLVRLVQFGAYLAGRHTEGRGIIIFSVAAGTALGAWLAVPR